MFRASITRVPRSAFSTAFKPSFSNVSSGRRLIQTKTNRAVFSTPVRSLNTSRKVMVNTTLSNSASNNTLNYVVGGAAAAGLIGLCASGFANAESDPNVDFVRSRMQYTYLYLAGSLGVTAVAAKTFFQSGLALKLASMNRWLVFGVSLAGMIGAQVVTRSIPYENTIPKHAALGAFCTIMGATLCPIVAVGGPLLTQAAVATGTIVGSLSLVGASAPEGSFSGMTGPLSVGLGCLLAASVGTMIFPQVGLLHNVVVYGGTALFGMFVLADTQKALERAKYSPTYDPINNCLGIYMDSINIFINMVSILSGSKKK